MPVVPAHRRPQAPTRAGTRPIATAAVAAIAPPTARVRLLVIPFAAGPFPGAGQTVNYLEGPTPQLDTVQVDSSHGPEFLGEAAQLAKYRAHLDWMERIALSPEASRDFVREIANDL